MDEFFLFMFHYMFGGVDSSRCSGICTAWWLGTSVNYVWRLVCVTRCALWEMVTARYRNAFLAYVPGCAVKMMLLMRRATGSTSITMWKERIRANVAFQREIEVYL